jgi:Domain of unknown function (DUF4282)
MEMRDIFFFDKMLTPTIITFVYWFILLAAVIGGLVTMFSGDFFYGLVTIVGGVLFGRIWCELLIVLFKMNEALQVMRSK